MLQPFVVGDSPGGYVDEAAHGPTGHVKGAGVGLRQRVIQVLLANSYHQLATRNAEGHVAVQHKANAAEHLLLAHTLSPCQHRPGTVGQFLVVGHLEHDYRAEHLAALHLMEGLLHVADADGLGDEPVEVEAALHVKLDEHGEVTGGQAVPVPG